MKLQKPLATLTVCVLTTSALLNHPLAAPPPTADGPREFDQWFTRMCDLATAELEKPIVPFADRKSADASTHHMPFFEDGHAVRALCVAYDRTGNAKYLSACQRWSDQMVAFQDRMIPAGAYYMNHSRAPGQDRGEWNVADSGSIAMGVLATAVRCANRDAKRYAAYINSVKSFAKLVMENYTGPGGGISNGCWSGYRGEWWCSTATAGSLLLLLHAETGEERYLLAGRRAMEWMTQQKFREAKPITFQQRPSGVVFYCFELYAIGLRHLAPGTPSHQLAQAELADVVSWMKEHPITQTPGDWETFDIHTDMAGLPYLKFRFARELAEYAGLPAAADQDLARIAGWLFSRGDPPVSQLIPWEVMSWGMLSFAERLSPGLLFRASTPAQSDHQRLRAEFLKMCDAACAELNTPERKVPFYHDSYAVRALAVAFDLTGERKYLDVCRKWSDRMIEYQTGMTPKGAYWMNYGRKPGETSGGWYVADCASIAMGVLATAVRCKNTSDFDRYLSSVQEYAKLVLDNYVGPGGGITDGLWSKFDGEWWCSSGIFSSFAFLLHSETGDEKLLKTALGALDWLNKMDFRKAEHIGFTEAAPSVVMYVFEGFSAGMAHLDPQSPLGKASIEHIRSALQWMRENQRGQGANCPWDYNKQWGCKLGGLPFHQYVYARYLPDGSAIASEADSELRYLSSQVFSDGQPKLSQLVCFTMMSYAEKLSPGAIYKK